MPNDSIDSVGPAMEFVKENATALICGSALLIGFAIYKCRNFRFAYAGAELEQQNPRAEGGLSRVKTKKDIEEVVVGENPLSKINKAKAKKGSIRNFSIDSSTSNETLEAVTGLVNANKNKKRR